MNGLKRLISALLAAVMLLAVAGCSNETDTTGATNPSSGTSTSGNYKVCVSTAGGMAMPGIEVYVYADDTLTNLVGYGQTDSEGVATMSLEPGSGYAVELRQVPKGYSVEKSYSFNGNTANISLNSSVVSDQSMSGAKLELGDIMYDFSVTTPYGETVTLSEVLAEKEVVVLNFWYNGCSACLYEFPYMQEAYEMYSDSVGIIAVDPLYDSSSTRSFQEENGLTFTMASVNSSWTTAFNVSGGDVDAYPTTVIIDRYGMICLIEEGALVNLRYWTSIFDHFTGDDYQQTLINTADDLLTRIKPTSTMPESGEISQIISPDLDITYRAEAEDEYSWPFVITEKDGEACIMSSNQEIDDSYAIMYADVYLEAGQALAVDYMISSENNSDILFAIVNERPIFQISGWRGEEIWETCYPCVAEEAGNFEVAFCYLKDSDTSEGEDTAYIKQIRIVDIEDVDRATYIVMDAFTENGPDYDYVDLVYNETDGYYHVGTMDGPLLLVNLLSTSEFNEETSIWEMAYSGLITLDGHDYYDELGEYASYASNSNLNGYCPVNKELAELLKVVDKVGGFDDEDDYEWLRACEYYKAYGTDQQMTDPILGLATFAPLTATFGTNVETNYFYYNRIILPRGMLAAFTPTTSGVYRITSRSENEDGVESWIFDKDRNELLCYAFDERMFTDSLNVSMVYYMEAGTTYYIDIAFWDPYEYGYIYYDIEYVDVTYELFRSCSPGYFTYDTDATGSAMYSVIAGGIDVVLGPDGYYHEDLGLDANGNQRYGSIIYCDFSGLTSIFSRPIATVYSNNEDGTVQKDENGNPVYVSGMIDLDGFDFSKTENDLYILAIMDLHDGDVEQTDAYLRDLWGEEYDVNALDYQIEDLYEGRYHGNGQDLTDDISAYLSKMYTGSQYPERQGCVAVDAKLAELLQKVMDKYTFVGVDHSWTKLCYYYDYLGPEG